MPKAVVLAGGLGSRLYPLTRVVPKPLIPFAGSPLLDYIVDKILSEGFSEVVVTARYLGEQIVNYLRNRQGVKALILDSKDTADAVRLVAEELSGDFVVSMGDVVTDVSFSEFYKSHVLKRVIASIVLKQVENPLPYGVVYVDENNFISHFAEKPKSLEVYLLTMAHHRERGISQYSNLVNAGIYAFRDEILDILLRNRGLMDFGKHVFPYLLEEGYKIYGWVAPEPTYWNDIGRADVYKEALWDLLEGRVKHWQPRGKVISKGIYVADDAVVEGTIYPPVYIGKGARVEAGATVGPYCVIEEGVYIGKGSKIAYSVVWHHAHLGEGVNVYDSILMNNATLKSGVKVVSSVVGTGCNVGVDLYSLVLDPCIQVSPYEVER